MRWAVIIPARLASTRFPRKPLATIGGKSLIRRVWEQCEKAVGRDQIYVATDSVEIADHVKSFAGRTVITSESCRTGTDRVWEAASALNLSHAINVQGDEPLVSPKDINRFIREMQKHPGETLNGMCPIHSVEEFRSSTVPKVVAAPDGRLLYMSRAAIPTNKDLALSHAWKQVCIYAFPKTVLDAFASTPSKTPLEAVEDIEILRLLELGFPVRMLQLESGAIAVDVPEDIPKVEAALEAGVE